MVRSFSKNWWVIVLRGVLAIVFGYLAFSRPGITLALLILFYGAYATVDGIFTLVSALRPEPGETRSGLLVLEGVLGILTGIIVFAWPGITALFLIYLMGFWAITTGILKIVVAVKLRKEMTNEFWLILSGIASTVFGTVVLFSPGGGAIAMVWLIACYAFTLGVLLVLMGLKMRSLSKVAQTPA